MNSAGRILVTGAAGFVARHFLTECRQAWPEAEVLGLDLRLPAGNPEEWRPLSVRFQVCDLLDREALRNVLASFRPDAVLHLAAFSSVAYSWEHPAECFDNNTCIFLNLIENLRELDLPARVLSVGSSEEYGNVSAEMLPLTEETPLNPGSPYAVARVSQEMLSRLFVAHYGMDIVLTRSFNHMGPGQDARFVIPGFIGRIHSIAARGERAGIIRTGDLSVIRDFVDVRDVVRAYRLLLEQGVAGEVYNICSGQGIPLSEVVEEIAQQCGVEVTCETDPLLLRPAENRVVTGSAEKLRGLCGWMPQIPLRRTLADMIAEMEIMQ